MVVCVVYGCDSQSFREFKFTHCPNKVMNVYSSRRNCFAIRTSWLTY